MLSDEGLTCARDETAARSGCPRAAEAGNAFAQAWLGDVLSQGLGVPADEETAISWYEKAAGEGYVGAIVVLSRLWTRAGMTSERQAALFAYWMTTAKAGDARAQRIVGDFYLRGAATARSVSDAVLWLEKAVAQGDVAAQ